MTRFKGVFIIFISLFFWGIIPGIAGAGTPHLIYGELKNSDDSAPANGTIKIEVYIKGRQGEVLTQSDTGCGFEDGMWWIEIGNFPSPWSVGERLHISTTNTSNDNKFNGEIELYENGHQNILLELARTNTNTGQGNAGETSGCFISAVSNGIYTKKHQNYSIIAFFFLPLLFILKKRSAKIIFRSTAKIFLAIIIFQFVFVTGKAFALTFELKKGVNGISVPYEDSGLTDAEKLANSIPNCNLVKYWDVSQQKYVEHLKGSSANNFNVIAGNPYFVRVTTYTNWTPPGQVAVHKDFELTKGPTTSINAVSVPIGRTDLETAENLIDEIPSCYTIWKWDNSKQAYIGHPNNTNINNFDIIPGHSYFVDMMDDRTWTQKPLDEIDNDNDGFTEKEYDCNDSDPDIYNGASESCNDNKDNDCDGATDCDDADCTDNAACQVVCADADSDTFFGQADCGTDVDCDDDNDDIYPGATEICNDNNDNDCNGKTDCDDSYCDGKPLCEGCTDADSDTYYAIEDSCDMGVDCNDNDKSIHPASIDICGDNIDQDCSGSDKPCYSEVNSVIPANNVSDVDVYPDIFAVFTEEMDSATINKDTLYVQTGSGDNLKTIEGTVSYNNKAAKFVPDSSLDYETMYKVTVTTGIKDLNGNPPDSDYAWSFTTTPGDKDDDGYTDKDGDCNDDDDTVYPNATEVCDDKKDNDCNGKTDCDDSYCKESSLCQVCTDSDKDSYFKESGCGTIPDCNDDNAGINPGKVELCDDNIDNDCDTFFDCDDPYCEGIIACITCTDADSDGYYTEIVCGTYKDCNDNNSAINPGVTELCNDNKDNDCDTKTDCDDTDCFEYPVCKTCTDADSDGYFAESGCGTYKDCNDNDKGISPGLSELCNDEKDNDCDTKTDCDDLSDCSEDPECKICTDDDSDGYYAESGCWTFQDCNDNDKGINPGVSELCNDEKDNDCDTKTDCDDSDCTEDPGCNVCIDFDSDGYFAKTGCGTLQDCNDGDAGISPGLSELCNDDKDNDCDTKTDCDDSDCTEDPGCKTCTDADSDGYFAENDCGTAIDCNDEDTGTYPGSLEKCGDEKDQNCNGNDLLCTVLPVVVATSPADDGKNTDVNVVVNADFSQIMVSQTVTADTFYVRTGQGYGLEAVPGTVTYSGATATFTPDSPLDYNTAYDAVITTGVKNPGGYSMETDYIWSFGTGSRFVSSTVPGNNDIGVSVGTAVSVSFFKDMDSSTIDKDSFYMRTGSGEYDLITIPGIITYKNRTATSLPEVPLDYNTKYDVALTTDIKDSDGNSLNDDYKWSFATLPIDPGTDNDVDNDKDGYNEEQGDCNDRDASIHPKSPERCGDGTDQNCDGDDISCDTAPYVTAVSPDDLTTDMNTVVIAIFSQVMDSQTVDGGSFYVLTEEEDNYKIIAGTVNYSGARATFSPSFPLAYGTTYNAIITKDAENIGGTSLDSEYTWSFTTIPDPADNDEDGYTESQGDCNDDNAGIYPGADEMCGDEIDNNCNNDIDEGCVVADIFNGINLAASNSGR
ncbi:MAG: hypothetical protein GY749_29975 [Desulfobacteraceae bacterium]|nr:hypothetical protein [Desulfobacteraceae bacterium]